MFRVIEGGLAPFRPAQGEPEEDRPATKEGVLREAERRIRATGYETWRNREALTGIPVPRETRYLVMQISYAAEAIARLAVIPADFRSDVYWPG